MKHGYFGFWPNLPVSAPAGCDLPQAVQTCGVQACHKASVAEAPHTDTMSAEKHCSSTCGTANASMDKLRPASEGKLNSTICISNLSLVKQLHFLDLQALEQLKEKMTSCSYGQPDEDIQKWFLRDRKLDVNEAAQKLTDMLKWRRDFQ